MATANQWDEFKEQASHHPVAAVTRAFDALNAAVGRAAARALPDATSAEPADLVLELARHGYAGREAISTYVGLLNIRNQVMRGRSTIDHADAERFVDFASVVAAALERGARATASGTPSPSA